jgi:hypothetical protein
MENMAYGEMVQMKQDQIIQVPNYDNYHLPILSPLDLGRGDKVP